MKVGGLIISINKVDIILHQYSEVGMSIENVENLNSHLVDITMSSRELFVTAGERSETVPRNFLPKIDFFPHQSFSLTFLLDIVIVLCYPQSTGGENEYPSIPQKRKQKSNS
jgi:hypothetical protein